MIKFEYKRVFLKPIAIHKKIQLFFKMVLLNLIHVLYHNYYDF